ncbi:MAG: hypothetical protein BGO76_02180 [Caedibacter sp. 38-128]|mgnify:CR=1 FL=1|nr:hypothetical protein [Holosporales bacterium]OJX08546.1 MAG: hypothetical protein BGO76_02180 [Caedibacter sp. 38-128]
MKISSFAQFLVKMSPHSKCFLIYGNNENLVYFREKVILNHLKKTIPSLQVHLLEEFIISETSSLSLFESEPSPVVYLYRRANDRLLKEVEKTLNQGSHYYILASPQLNSKAKLVDFALKHPSVAAIPSYTIEDAEITKVIHDFCQETSLNLHPEAKKILFESLMSNPSTFESQLQKAALFYSGASSEFSPSAFKELFISKEEGDLFKMKEAFFKGDTVSFTQLWNTLKQDDFQDISLIRFLQAEAFRSLKGPGGGPYQIRNPLSPLQVTRLLSLLLNLETTLKWQPDLPENYLLQMLLQWLPTKSLETR